MRIDKWLWAARFFKTRRLATEACQAGKVKLNGRSVKPGRAIKTGDELQITRQLYKQRIRVTGLQERRVAPKIAATLYEDLTPQEEIEQAQLQRTMESAFYREHRRAGRPTKRDRRALQKLKGKF
ncbi:MAG: RNA-binding S4 domain-containing protein [Candidatus Neomarinimicrobiota bacterium]